MFIVWRGFLYNQINNQINNQIEAILSQYDLEVKEVIKGRGTYICDTDKGMRLLIGFRSAKEKGEALRIYLKALEEEGFPVEQIEVNKNSETVTIDEITGEGFVLKEYISGEELNVNRIEELKEAAALLAKYHNAASKIAADGIAKDVDIQDVILDEKERHYREIVKVRNYIRNRKKKSDFERIYLKHHEKMLQTAKESIFILDANRAEQPSSCVCHGEYNQHNVVFTEDGWRMIHFENCVYRWCIFDLANFLRKMQEKNDWDILMGKELLDSYTKVRALSKSEYEKLYGLLLFPEKFWKVTNHYMNSRKTWISEKDIEKLKKVIAQESKRLAFIEYLFAIEKE